MKKIIMILGLAAMMVACASGPEKAAKNFTENLSQGKLEKAKEYATESAGKMLDMASAFGGLPIDADFEFNMVKDSVVDNKAWVTFVNQKGEEETLELVKIDGDWLVHMDLKK